jgi:hypothetical protein
LLDFILKPKIPKKAFKKLKSPKSQNSQNIANSYNSKSEIFNPTKKLFTDIQKLKGITAIFPMYVLCDLKDPSTVLSLLLISW